MSGSWPCISARATAARTRHWALVRPMAWARWSIRRRRSRQTSCTRKTEAFGGRRCRFHGGDIISRLIIGKLANMSHGSAHCGCSGGSADAAAWPQRRIWGGARPAKTLVDPADSRASRASAAPQPSRRRLNDTAMNDHRQTTVYPPAEPARAFPKIEEAIGARWEAEKTFQRSIERRREAGRAGIRLL